MPLPTPDMEDCCEKKRCVAGTANEGLVYSTCEPCREGGTFNEKTCDCEFEYFAEYAWYQLTLEEFRIAPGCVPTFNYPNDAKIIAASITGEVDVIASGLEWTVIESGVPFCSTEGAGACSTAGGRHEDGFITFPGTGAVTPAIALARTTCFGQGSFNDSFRQTFFETGVTIGYGATLQEAICDAKNKAPDLNLPENCDPAP